MNEYSGEGVMGVADETLRDLMLRLRRKGQPDELSQPEFALILGVSRSTVAAAESGEPGPLIGEALLARYPDEEEAIARVAPHRHRSTVRAKRRTQKSQTLDKVESLIDQHRYDEAEGSLHHALLVLSEPTERVQAYKLLAQMPGSATITAEEESAYRMALDVSTANALREEEVDLRFLLAGRLQRVDRFEDALVVVDAGIRCDASDIKLWRRRGICLWYAHRFPDAYASLTTALYLGDERLRVYHARGAALAEWGHHAQAIVELSAVIADPSLSTSAMSRAYARNGLALAYAGLGEDERALRQWALSEEVQPRNAWLHYFRARWYLGRGDDSLALEAFRRALTFTSPPLSGLKRVIAESCINDIELRLDSASTEET